VDAGHELPDAGPDCQRDDQGACVPIEWTYGDTAPAEVDHHGTFIHQVPDGRAFLYVVGGVRTANASVTQTYNHVLRGALGDDGNVTAWETLGNLPLKLGYHSTLLHNGFVYLLAGVTEDAQGVGASIRVYLGTPDDQGLFTWRSSRTLPQVVRTHATADVINGKLYLIGGGNSVGTSLVTVADVNADGTLGTWSEPTAAQLPHARSHHGSVVHDNRIYLLGGFDENTDGVDSVIRSVHGEDGALSGWETVGVLVDPPWTPAVVTLNNRIYVMGGGLDDENLNRVRIAPIGEDGLVGEFVDADAMPEHRSHVHQTPVYRGRVYSVGGRTGANFNSNGYVLVGRVN